MDTIHSFKSQLAVVQRALQAETVRADRAEQALREARCALDRLASRVSAVEARARSLGLPLVEQRLQ